ncbi:hypothetical protein D779_0296 [Imhoffiella purpurea]|uniref:Uncharacterized protein n=1 Tax=Imhoffiella purpurea TaxID=1249627 RepID=W9VJW7_9GAMM|nr:hypothetical protein D779_0296 [Imhoffiella purpurea]
MSSCLARAVRTAAVSPIRRLLLPEQPICRLGRGTRPNAALLVAP